MISNEENKKTKTFLNDEGVREAARGGMSPSGGNSVDSSELLLLLSVGSGRGRRFEQQVAVLEQSFGQRVSDLRRRTTLLSVRYAPHEARVQSDQLVPHGFADW